MFGNKDNSTLISFKNDTVQYSQSLTSNQANFGGLFFNGGLQYEVKLRNKKSGKESIIRYGVYGNWKQTMNASSTKIGGIGSI
jgi:hypothetical protein